MGMDVRGMKMRKQLSQPGKTMMMMCVSVCVCVYGMGMDMLRMKMQQQQSQPGEPCDTRVKCENLLACIYMYHPYVHM